MGGRKEPSVWPAWLGGKELVKFEELRRLQRVKRGGFGSVYRARRAAGKDGGGSRDVAVKILTGKGTTAQRMFVQEAAILKHIRHRSIVGMIGLCNIPKGAEGIPEAAHSDRMAIVQEFLEGGTLQCLVMEKMLEPFNLSSVYSELQALDLMIDIAEALEYLHNCKPQILHRDVTSTNILIYYDQVQKRKRAKLVDLGLTALVQNEHGRIPYLGFGALQAGSCPIQCPAQYKRSNLEVELSDPSRILSTNGSNRITRTSRDSSRGSAGRRPNEEKPTCIEIHVMQSKWGASQALPTSRIYTCPIGTSDADAAESDGMSAWESRRSEIESTVEGDTMSQKHLLSEKAGLFNLTGKTGSYMYMAPEVFSKKPYGETADVFSFGTILFEVFSKMCITVAEPTWFPSHYGFRVSLGYRPTLTSKIPSGMKRIIEQCWMQDPTDRPNMTEVVERLRKMREACLTGRARDTCAVRCCFRS